MRRSTAAPDDWQKSSFSGGDGGDGDGNGNDCVELASTPTTLHLRESDDPATVLTTTTTPLTHLLHAIRADCL
ncbi:MULTISPECIES: DUF397 domain-containing protein [unclassified Streptomyces]|uniref:DUF397 domain-containing protein n=1 Tax=unclassified Streptomyces TaxID=2593676 RepID=UPI0037F74867